MQFWIVFYEQLLKREIKKFGSCTEDYYLLKDFALTCQVSRLQ